MTTHTLVCVTYHQDMSVMGTLGDYAASGSTVMYTILLYCIAFHPIRYSYELTRFLVPTKPGISQKRISNGSSLLEDSTAKF